MESMGPLMATALREPGQGEHQRPGSRQEERCMAAFGSARIGPIPLRVVR
jgi:hypothetical protein